MTHSTIEETLSVNTRRNSGSPLGSLNEAAAADTPFVWDI
jgi:hypothetical protein